MVVPSIIFFAAIAAQSIIGAVEDVADREYVCPGMGNFPNPDDCSSFYVCGCCEHALMQCPGDLLFDAKLQICNNPESVACTIQTTTASTVKPSTSRPVPTTKVPSTSTEVPSTLTEVPETTTFEPPTTSGFAPTCPATGTDFIENPANCTTFYVCIDGHYGLAECPEGFGFDPVTKDCLSSQDTGCLITTSTTPTPNAPVVCPPTGQQLFPNTGDCGSFYICQDGSFDLITCPIGYEFDPNSSHCEPAEANECGSSKPPMKPPSFTCSDKPNGAIFANPTDCTKFYQCSNGAVVTNSCPPGLEFNAEKSVCDQPGSANCHVLLK